MDSAVINASEAASGSGRDSIGSDSFADRLMNAIAISPDASNVGRLRQALVLAFGVMMALAGATFFTNSWYETIQTSPLPLRLFNLLFSAFAVLSMPFAVRRRWRLWVLFCFLVMVSSYTLSALAVHDEEPVFAAFLIILLDSSLLVPWGGKWQAWLALVNVASFIVIATARLILLEDIPGWIALETVSALSISLAALKVHYGQQRILISQLRQREESLRDENGRRTRAEQRLRLEVTERQAAQTLAQKREASLRKVLETSLDKITIMRLPEMTYVYANERFSETGYSFAEVKGRTLAEVNTFADPDQARALDTITRRDGMVQDFEIDVRTKSGTIVPYLISSVVIDFDGEPCVVSMGRDITKRKQMEHDLIAAREDALAASRAKSEFLSSMSHEIRTPMNAVLGMADLLMDTRLTAEQRRYIDVMVANGNSLLELINSILDLARIESGRLQIEHTEFDLTELIDKTISTFGVQAHSKGLELIARIAPGVHTHLVGDPLRLRQILVNFLGNAIKFTEKGEVVLEVKRSGDNGELSFEVRDTGIGIPPTKLQEIFSSFTQADSSTTRRYGGTGLGLAIARRLVQLMNGKISVESEPGKGSKFAFTAPFELATRVISPTAHVLLNLDHYRVLIVDDNQINRLIAREMITNCGAEVSEAESGEDALMAIRQASAQGKPYSIILLDMRMPGMNGLEVAQRIRDEHLPLEPLILMLSSDDLKPQLSRLKDLGLDAYLVKPITRKELFDAIGRVLRDANRNSSDTIALPRPGAPAASPTAARTSAAPAAKTRILVADDSSDNRLLIGAYLRREPCILEFAEDGKIALQKFKSNEYDMVFMDVQMPELDGLAATRLIRRWESENHRTPTPIIALTASALEDDVARTLAAGCDLHLSKPIKKVVLLDTIGTVSALRGKTNAHEAALIRSAS